MSDREYSAGNIEAQKKEEAEYAAKREQENRNRMLQNILLGVGTAGLGAVSFTDGWPGHRMHHMNFGNAYNGKMPGPIRSNIFWNRYAKDGLPYTLPWVTAAGAAALGRNAIKGAEGRYEDEVRKQHDSESNQRHADLINALRSNQERNPDKPFGSPAYRAGRMQSGGTGEPYPPLSEMNKWQLSDYAGRH